MTNSILTYYKYCLLYCFIQPFYFDNIDSMYAKNVSSLLSLSKTIPLVCFQSEFRTVHLYIPNLLSAISKQPAVSDYKHVLAVYKKLLAIMSYHSHYGTVIDIFKSNIFINQNYWSIHPLSFPPENRCLSPIAFHDRLYTFIR